MKKLFIVIILLSFSFYYTNKVVDILKNTDPIMKEIKNTKDKYKINPINAEIINDNIIPGVFGKEIDYDKSYHQMKRYGTYNESLTVIKDTKPVISIEDNYDKYIIKGNNKSNNISLVFIDNNPNRIMNILDNKKVSGTFFIDGTILEKNYNLFKSTTHEIELLSYNNSYQKEFFKTSLSFLESITKEKPMYCYTEEDNNDLLKLCSKYKLHTIKPTLIIEKDLYKQLKNNVKSSYIITIKMNNYMEDDLKVGIDYLKKKGFNIVNLRTLLQEN